MVVVESGVGEKEELELGFLASSLVSSVSVSGVAVAVAVAVRDVVDVKRVEC